MSIVKGPIAVNEERRWLHSRLLVARACVSSHFGMEDYDLCAKTIL